MNRKLYKGGLTAGVLPLRAIYTPFLIFPFALDVERKNTEVRDDNGFILDF